jgi:hypothetical protein
MCWKLNPQIYTVMKFGVEAFRRLGFDKSLGQGPAEELVFYKRDVNRHTCSVSPCDILPFTIMQQENLHQMLINTSAVLLDIPASAF